MHLEIQRSQPSGKQTVAGNGTVRRDAETGSLGCGPSEAHGLEALLYGLPDAGLGKVCDPLRSRAERG